MKPDIYWIPGLPYGRLAIMPRPRGGDWLDGEVNAWKMAGIDVVVSLLTPREVMELGLQNEAQSCTDRGIRYFSYPIPDRQVPASRPTTLALIKDIDTWLKAGQGVAVHCWGGIGRSGLLAACTLVAQGFLPQVAFAVIGESRGIKVPETDEQQRWVEDFFSYWSRESGS
jgi:protein-tyrosine phosphatase